VTRTLLASALLAVALGVAAPATPAPETTITVFAASSLTDVFPRIDRQARYSFAGSNTLAAQIEQGAPADVFASANMAIPQQLHDKHLCSKPVAFARNKLVVVVPRSNAAHLHRVNDLARKGVKVVIADMGVPVGSYTLQVLKALRLSRLVLANVVSRETDVRDVLAKVVLGEADAGFVYSTDAKTVAGDVKVIKIPSKAEPGIRYGICVVSASEHRAGARAFVTKVLSKAAQAKLRRAGFLPRR
jgi:molybdate transport system substrate-binding protein